MEGRGGSGESSFFGEGEPRGVGVPVCNRHQVKGDTLRTQGGGGVHQSVTGTKGGQ